MKTNFQACLAFVLVSEGGYVNHPADKGGPTNRGITLDTYRLVRPGATIAELKSISDEMVAQIYRTLYWDKVRGDDLPAGLDLIAFDGAVNSGVWRGARWLQSAVGVAADGQIGAITIRAAQSANAEVVIRRAIQARKNFMLSLPTWPVFGNGWSARLTRLEKSALNMAKGV